MDRLSKRFRADLEWAAKEESGLEITFRQARAILAVISELEGARARIGELEARWPGLGVKAVSDAAAAMRERAAEVAEEYEDCYGKGAKKIAAAIRGLPDG